MLIDSPSSQEVLPPPSRLDAVVATLSGSQDHRNLIGFVERWSSVQVPSPRARLAQARSFLALGQVDRAWIRLRQLIESESPSLEAVKLTAELFLVRGWPARARDLLQVALTDHPDDRDLQALWDQAASPRPPAPSLSRVDVDDLPVDDLVDHALDQLAQGHATIARGILERASHAGVADPRVGDLLWAMRGELAPAESLADLTDRWTPVDHTLGLLASEDENTESITQEEVRRILEDVDEGTGESGFPTLFRHHEVERVDDEITEEVTSTVARIEGSHLDAPTQPDLDEEDYEDEGDTRIVRVLNRKGLPLHTNHSDPDEDFDFGAYRSEMGMSMADLGSFGSDLEDEDDDLVVLTHREPIQLPTADQVAGDDPTMSQIGREVAHLLGGRPTPAPKPPAGPADPSASSGSPARPRAHGPEQDGDPAVGELDDDVLELVPPRRKRQVRSNGNLFVWLGVIALLLVGAVVGLGALLIGWLLTG